MITINKYINTVHKVTLITETFIICVKYRKTTEFPKKETKRN